METESGAKISIRGKGSIKEGKARQDGVLAPGEEEDLHCLVTADSEEKIAKAVKLINKIIETVSLPLHAYNLKNIYKNITIINLKNIYKNIVIINKCLIHILLKLKNYVIYI